ncbi:transposase IS3 IS911 family protein [Companilactobacillus versmoldensis DSM 14857 = KCTC 3814]|uniref:Transposase IS3 IS911 family protein n=2 Tax=Companilactobacillus versmoldensis TaxID=194326 RepID=A0A0R1S9K4_9LACO|nr:transposase IS3 IS911 family protein [Companilactobacillus versmoldensis DSM 14857 = KCTC 3814]
MVCFFMTKYSYRFKLKLVKEYLDGRISYNDLVIKYSMNHASDIKIWVSQFEANGAAGLKVKRSHTKYTQDFKLSVVDYYQTHDVGAVKVAAHFNISPSQVANWTYRYKNDGVVGLRTNVRGRKSMTKKPKKRKKLSPTKEEAYKQEITDLKKKLYYSEMDHEFLKTLKALRENEHRNSK